LSSAGWLSAASSAWRVALLGALAHSVGGCSADSSSSAAPPSARCASCHLPEFQSTTHPPHPGVRPTTCGVCHGESGWHPVRNPFLHSFPLEGGHAKPACFACHTGPNPQFEGTTHECVACHQRDQTSANAKIAHHDTFPSKCDTCHSIQAWKPTLPHDEELAAAPASTEHAAVSPASSALGSGKPTKATAPPSTAWPTTQPTATRPTPTSTRPTPTATRPTPTTTPTSTWTPDQVSGASRVKKH